MVGERGPGRGQKLEGCREQVGVVQRELPRPRQTQPTAFTNAAPGVADLAVHWVAYEAHEPRREIRVQRFEPQTPVLS